MAYDGYLARSFALLAQNCAASHSAHKKSFSQLLLELSTTVNDKVTSMVFSLTPAALSMSYGKAPGFKLGKKMMAGQMPGHPTIY